MTKVSAEFLKHFFRRLALKKKKRRRRRSTTFTFYEFFPLQRALGVESAGNIVCPSAWRKFALAYFVPQTAAAAAAAAADSCSRLRLSLMTKWTAAEIVFSMNIGLRLTNFCYLHCLAQIVEKNTFLIKYCSKVANSSQIPPPRVENMLRTICSCWVTVAWSCPRYLEQVYFYLRPSI